MSDNSQKSVSEIRGWLVSRIADKLSMPEEEVPTDQPLTRLGIDSTEAVVFSGELQEWLGTPVAPTAVWDHPTIDALAAHLGRGA
jgi:acyl carrier protein